MDTDAREIAYADIYLELSRTCEETHFALVSLSKFALGKSWNVSCEMSYHVLSTKLKTRGGHYRSFRKEDDAWVYSNDAASFLLSFDQIEADAPHLLFYSASA